MTRRYGSIRQDQLADLKFWLDPKLTDRLAQRRLAWLGQEYQRFSDRGFAAGRQAAFRGIIIGLARGDRRRVRWERRWLWLQHYLWQLHPPWRALSNEWAASLLRKAARPVVWRPITNLIGGGDDWPQGETTGTPGLVSIVMPVYNQAIWLGEALAGVIDQTYQNWELIIVNDGSSDDPVAVVAPYLSDQRIYFIDRPHQGLPAALSFGFQRAQGEFFTWNSADNILAPDNLATLVGFLKRQPGIHFTYSDFEAIDERGEPFRAHFSEYGKWLIAPNYVELKRTTEDLNMTHNFIGASFMYRSSAARVVGDYDGALGVEDYDFFMRFNNLFAMKHVGERRSLLKYRYHGASLSGADITSRQSVIRARKRVLLEFERTERQPCLTR